MTKFFYPTINGQSKAQLISLFEDEMDMASANQSLGIPENFKVRPVDKKRIFTDDFCQSIVNELAIMYDEGEEDNEEDMKEERQTYFIYLYYDFFKAAA